jgi:hypothetical protein
MKPFNVGVLGIGDISNVYISNLKSYDIVSVVACAGRDLEKARRKAELHGLPKAYATAAELIADPDIDIVLNLTLPAVHAELTTMALEAGKHVYTEKPLAATYVEGRRILALAKERGLSVCCAPDTILGGRLQTCRGLIDDGSIGDVTAASAFVVSHVDGPNLFGGPVLVRDIDTYRWKGLPRRQPYSDWREIPVTHRFNDLSHRKNSRGIGLVDMAYALVGEREARTNGAMALHCLEIMEGVLISATERRFFDFESRCERPAPLTVNFPDSESVR